jgi:hypothetical protein
MMIYEVPETKTIDDITGRETLTKGTASNITDALFLRMDKTWMFDETAKIEGGDAYVMVKPTVTLNEQDYITADSVTYEVRNLITINAGGTDFFKFGKLFIKRYDICTS